MNEFILVEFVAIKPHDAESLMEKLLALDSDFSLINKKNSSGMNSDGIYSEWIIVQGKISSAYASVIKLQNPFLSERMHISYISTELKEKYRR